jgi:hypothetical protein
MPETDPLNSPPPAVLAFLAERARRTDDGSTYFADDAGLPLLATDVPGCPHAGPREAAAWTLQHRRDLWGDTAKPETKPAAPTTMSGIMAAVRAGEMSVDQATASMFAHAALVPSKPAAAHRSRRPSRI